MLKNKLIICIFSINKEHIMYQVNVNLQIILIFDLELYS